MRNRDFLLRLAIQLSGNLVLGTLAWYWLGLGVGTGALVAANAGLAIVLVLGWSVLDAHGLGRLRQWRWAVPAVVLAPLMLWHWLAALAVLLLWVIVLLPTAAAGRWFVLMRPGYVARCGAALAVMIATPWGLLNWVPGLQGLTPELISFGLRAGVSYLVAVSAWTLVLWLVSETVTSASAQSLP